MLLLTKANAQLRVVAADATPVLRVHASWVDNEGYDDKGRPSIKPDSWNVAIDAAGSAVVVASPAANVQRNIRLLSIYNKGTETALFAVEHFDGTAASELISIELAAGYTLTWTEAGWSTEPDTSSTAYSGFSGYSGKSGYSGISGQAGGESGISGYSGWSGYSGRDGVLGSSGSDGQSGISGYSGGLGASGYSGYSGFSGSGISGYSGAKGDSGAGTSGYSGFSGYSGAGGSGVSDLSSLPRYAGFVTYVTPTMNGDGTITFGAADVYFYANGAYDDQLIKYTLSGGTLTPTDATTSYLVGDYNGGSPVFALVTDKTLIDFESRLPYCTLYRAGNAIHYSPFHQSSKGNDGKAQHHDFHFEHYGWEFGLDLGSVNDGGTPKYTISDGQVWVGLHAQVLGAMPYGGPSTHNFFCYHVGGVWTTTHTANSNVINNTQYDDGTDLASVDDGSYVTNYIYRGIEPQLHGYVVLGNEPSATDLQTAIAGLTLLDDLPELITSHAMLIGAIIIQKGGTACTIVKATNEGFGGGAGGVGASGYSGYSGASGYSGSGASGYSGFSGYSGPKGDVGVGQSGTSGYSGISGFSGYSGTNGTVGTSGWSGISGYSGFSGSGVSGWSGISGYSGTNGTVGTSGFSGSGVSGYSGFSGSGTSGYSGFSGSGTSGWSGISGYSGTNGTVGTSGWSGISGYSGSGTSGWSGAGTSGYSGYSGSGTSGWSGISGWSGTNGLSGTSGYSGWSGYSGPTGTSGFSGANPGASGYSGYSGYSGVRGVWLRRTILNGGTGSHQSLSNTGYADVFLWGGGAGGGGASSTTASSGAVGGAGGEGGYTAKFMTMAASTYFNWGVGLAALGGVGALSGVAGNPSVFSGSTILLASGGLGGGGGAQSATAAKVIYGGSGAPAGSSGDVIWTGAPGALGMMISQVVGGVGPGGGKGGANSLPNASANGNNSRGIGGGGGGALLITSGLRSGGSGGAGQIIIDEYQA